jgi:parallel beta-helix repeat protein
MYITGVGAPIRNNYIANNTASAKGGGAYIKNETMIGNVIIQNTASSGGGGIAIDGNSSPSIEDCIIAKNEAIGLGTGGGIYSYTSSSPSIKSCTVTENVAYIGGGISVHSSYATIDNSIVWGNSALSDPELSISLAGGSFTVSYSDIGGGWTGSGNIDADPLFQPGPQGDYYLSQKPSGQLSNSPCRNAGMPGLPLPASTTRSDGMGDTNILDMGYHYPLGPPSLVVENLIASQQSTFRTEGGHPGAKVYFCYSLAGQGPIVTTYGFILNLTPPIGGGPKKGWSHFANNNGEASMTVTVPSGAAGALLWLQVVESLSGTFRVSNLVATTVK